MRWLLRICLAGFILLALYLSLMRYYLPRLSDYRDDFEITASYITQTKFRLGSLQGRLYGLTPNISATDISLLNKKDNSEIVSIKSLSFSPDIKCSILKQLLCAKSLKLDDPVFVFHENENNRWSLLNKASNTRFSIEDIKSILSSFISLSAANLKLRFNYRDGSKIEAPYLNLALNRSEQFRRMSIESFNEYTKADSNSKNAAQFYFLFEGEGALNADDLRGQWLLKSKDANLSVLAVALLANNMQFSVRGNNLNLQGAIDPQQGHVVHGTIDVAALSVQKNNASILNLENVQGDFHWHDKQLKKYREQKLWLQNVYVQQKGIKHLITDKMIASLSSNKYAQQFKVAANSLNIEPVAVVLGASNLMPKNISNKVNALHLSGSLQQPQFFLQRYNKNKQTNASEQLGLEFSSNFKSASCDAGNGIPELRRINGRVWANNKFGLVTIDKESQVSAHFKNIYRNPFTFDKVTAAIAWDISDHVLNLYSHALAMKYRGSNVGGWFAVKHYFDKHIPTVLTLNLGLRNIPAQEQKNLVPMVVSSRVRQFLNKSINGGTIEQGAILLHGPVGSQMRSHSLREAVAPVLQIALHFRNLHLNYSSQWPALKAASGNLWMEQLKADIHVDNGKILDSQIKNTQALLSPLASSSSAMQLDIKGNINGSAQNILTAVNNSNVNRSLSQAAQDWLLHGAVQTQLAIKLFLGGQKKAPQVKVNAKLKGVDFSLKKQNIIFKGLQGELRYDSTKDTLQSNQIKASLFGHPVVAHIYPKKCEHSMQRCLNIELQGSLSGSSIADLSPQAMLKPLFKYIEGTTHYTALVQLEGEHGLNLVLTSALKGLKSSLPAPFGKAADEPLALRYQQTTLGDKTNIDLSIHDKLTLKSQEYVDGRQGVVLNLGAQSPKRRIAEPGKFLITGNLPTVAVTQWIPLAKELHMAKVATPQQGFNYQIEDLIIKHLDYGDKYAADVALNMQTQADSYLFNIDSRLLAGELRYSKTDIPLDIKLTHLNLSEVYTQTIATDSVATDVLAKVVQNVGEQIEPLDLSGFPDVNFYAEKVMWSDKAFGKWSFKLRKNAQLPRSYAIKDITGQLGSMLISSADSQGAQYIWDNEIGSSFTGRVTSNDVEDELKKLGYNSVLKAKKAMLDVEVHWQGGLNEFSLLKSQGHWDITLENGYLLKSPAAATGILKVISLANLAGILSDLRLSFGDLVEEGLSFNKLKGSFNSGAGVFETAKPLHIRGSSSTVEVDGFLNMKTSQLDAELVVTIPIRGNLPWVVGLLGGLPAAVGIFLLSKFLKSTVDQLSSLVYEVTGDINSPKVKFKRLFNLSLFKGAYDRRSVPKSPPITSTVTTTTTIAAVLTTSTLTASAAVPSTEVLTPTAAVPSTEVLTPTAAVPSTTNTFVSTTVSTPRVLDTPN